MLLDTLHGIRNVADEVGLPMACLAVAWLKAQPGVSSVIIGGRDERQVTRNLAAVDVSLDSTTLALLDRMTLPLKEYMGHNADMWISGEDSRIQ